MARVVIRGGSSRLATVTFRGTSIYPVDGRLLTCLSNSGRWPAVAQISRSQVHLRRAFHDDSHSQPRPFKTPRQWRQEQQQQQQRSRARALPLTVRIQPLLIGLSVTLIGYHIYSNISSPLLLDSPTFKPPPGGELLANLQGRSITPVTGDLTQEEQMRRRAQTQGLYLWGSNRYNVVAPDAPLMTFVRSPRSIPYFDGMALRHVLLEEKHAAAIDADGDLLQWGLGFFDAASRTSKSSDSSGDIEEVPLGRRRGRIRANELTPLGCEAAQAKAPVKTLKGKNLVKVVGSENKVYALSKKGEVFVLSALQVLQQPGKPADWSWNPFTFFGLFASRTVDYARLQATANAKLARGEKVVDIDAGLYHLVALTNKGRTFSCPIGPRANDYGQLGTKRVWLNSPSAPGSTAVKQSAQEATLEPRIFRLDKFYENESKLTLVNLLPDWALPPQVAGNGKESLKSQKLPFSPSTHPLSRLPPDASAAMRKAVQEEVERRERELALAVTEPPSSIRYCTTLHEIPSLRGIVIDQISVGNEHSLARTSEGRVLAWGRHTHGQCGLGSQVVMESVPVPTEVVLSRCFNNSSRDVSCIGIKAGADNSFFITSRRDATSIGTRGTGDGFKIDVLAAGKGQWGTLGNAMWSQVAASPVRVKAVSGLMEYSEITGKTHPVNIYSLSVGRPGHVTLVLDTADPGGHVAFGRDVMVWGHNAAFQLGNGKRANLSVPQCLKPLLPLTKAIGDVPSDASEDPEDDPSSERNGYDKETQKDREVDTNSGALMHMPHNRLQLTSRTKVDTRSSLGREKANKHSVTVEEEIVAGATASGVFWKLHP
ncbi:RCC1/BLIP-II [Tilletiaria anomala UBC 951]|uniref:RCC1/BLIP-II n=1 Tax=Tilletiaria anomala (strain ATCC 24038 / CBS 436.72 / UBC 951) TaxID=1037660 RepID=A0A066VQR0_TILAU|nr:RCC1/BLIP-II [Tilletiaria anomala UBC 951]KDN44082.1 RCC1/BLIP-II [Tilletiaria anomala UBC 951]